MEAGKSFYRGQETKWQEIAAPAPRPQPPPGIQGHGEVRKKLHGPASDHPWKLWNPTRPAGGRNGSRRCRGLRKVQTTGLSSALYSAFFGFITKGTFLIW